MKKLGLVMASLMMAGSFASLPALAQSAPAAVKQRAPGVPLAPRAGEAVRPPAGERPVPRTELRAPRDDRAQAAPQPNRDPPMPRPVPSIIAP